MDLAYPDAVALGDSPLLGRDAALAELKSALASGKRGRGELIVISGDAGIGKTTLLDAAALHASELGYGVVQGRAWEFADAPPLFPLSPALRSLGIDAAREGGEVGAFALWERALEALARCSDARPVAWTVEDVHAADLQSIDLLTFLARPLRALRAVVVVTLRPGDARLSERARERISRMLRDGRELRLEPLSPSDVAALASRTAGFELGNALQAHVAELSGGNPLFVVEVAKALAAARDHRGALSTLPPTVRQLMMERARFLSEASRRTLEAGAVVGREFSAAVVARALGLMPAQVIEGALPLLAAGLVFETEPGCFRFPHALVRDAFYDAVPPSQRAGLHARVADALEAGTDTTEMRMSVAHHALSSLPVDDVGRTLARVERAERILSSSGAHDRAFALRQRADVARRQGLLPAASPKHLLESARLALAAGRFTESTAQCKELLAQGRGGADARLVARAALALGASLRPGVVDPELVAALQEADAGLTAADVALQSLVRARLAAALQPSPTPDVPVRMARAAVDAARSVGDDELLREVLFFAGSAFVDYAPVSQRLECAAELLSLAERTGDPARALTACARMGMDVLHGGDFDAFSRWVDRSLQISDALGRAPRHRWRPLLAASMRAAALGRFDESERLQVEVAELAAHCDDPALSVSAFAHHVVVLRLQRHDDAVRAEAPRVQQMAAAMGDPGMGHAVCAMLLARSGDVDATRAALDAAAPHLPRLEAEPDLPLFFSEAIALAGTTAERERVLGQLRASSAREAVMGHVFIMTDGPVARLSALVEASLGDHEAAHAHLMEALEYARARHHRPWVAQIEYELGRLALGAGRPAAAREHLRASMTTARELGMVGLVAALERDLGAAPRAEPAVAAPLLLSREGEAWRVQRGEHSVIVRDSRGMQLLSRLVERPGEEIHVLALVADGDDPLADSDAGEHLDDTARTQYRARLRELEREMDEADVGSDRARLQRLGAEREALVAELSRAVGLGGRSRRAGAATERARINVQKRLKQAIGAIEAADAELGAWLAPALRTGAFCSYRPL